MTKNLLASADDMIQEYCIYRGFVNSFRVIEQERTQDKTKSFEASLIVTQIWDYLDNGGIDHFLSLWEFLSKRFFANLDEEHCSMFVRLKLDLIKYYFVKCFRKNKPKLIEFFTKYTKEILSFGSGNMLAGSGSNGGTGSMGNTNSLNVNVSIGTHSSLGSNIQIGGVMSSPPGAVSDAGFDNSAASSSSSSSSSSSLQSSSASFHLNNWGHINGGCENDLRRWYVLPYLENPENDREFMVFFSQSWQDSLKSVLFNYITVVLRSAPAPRLLLIDNWFRSETQVEVRRAMESSKLKISAYEKTMDAMHKRLEELYNIIQKLVTRHVDMENHLKDGEDKRANQDTVEVLSNIQNCVIDMKAFNASYEESRWVHVIGHVGYDEDRAEHKNTSIREAYESLEKLELKMIESVESVIST